METLYAIVAKKLLIKNKDKKLDFAPRLYAGIMNAPTLRIYKSRKEATGKLNAYGDKVRGDYDIVRIQTNFPEGHFKVTAYGDQERGTNVYTVGKFTKFADAIEVATGKDGWGGDNNIIFVPAKPSDVFDSVAAWKKKKELPAANRPVQIRDHNGQFNALNVELLKQMTEFFVIA